jgi:hypothetical protein
LFLPNRDFHKLPSYLPEQFRRVFFGCNYDEGIERYGRRENEQTDASNNSDSKITFNGNCFNFDALLNVNMFSAILFPAETASINENQTNDSTTIKPYMELFQLSQPKFPDLPRLEVSNTTSS